MRAVALGTTNNPTVEEAFAALRDARSGRDPVPLYEPFLAQPGPVRLANGDFVAAHHADVVEVLRNPAFGKLPPPPQPTRSLRVVMRLFLMLDPPAHTRLRKVVAPHFTGAAVAGYRRRLTELADEAIDQVGGSTVDVVSDFAYPFPFAFICELIGARTDDWGDLSGWTTTLTRALDEPLPMRVRDAVPMVKALATRRIRPLELVGAVNGIVAYARDRIANADAPIADCLRTGRANGELSADEAASTWVLLFLAGHETSANLIANVVHALVTHPDERAKVTTAGVAAAVEETLRWDPPVPLNGRMAKATTELGGVRIDKGTFVNAVVGAANRDPSVFEAPDEFRIDRTQSPAHLSFGQGTHFCLGAQLARAEVEVGLETVLRRAPDLRLAGEPRRRRTFSVSGFESLPLELAPPY